MSRVIRVQIKVLNDPGDKGEFEVDQDIVGTNVYRSFEDTAQDWELQQEVNELADAIDRIMGAS
jgi:hypothetical protein